MSAGVQQSRAMCSTRFQPSLPAGRVGVLSPLYAVFMVTKTEARVQICKYKWVWKRSRLDVKADEEYGINALNNQSGKALGHHTASI